MKSNKKRTATLAAAIGVAAVGAVAVAGVPALADPVSNGYSIVGSDTLQEAVGAIANGTDVTGANVRIALNGTTLASYDAFPSAASLSLARGIPGALIQTKEYGPAFVRPQGSGNGVQALSASYNVDSDSLWLTTDITGQVQASRSSSGRTANGSGPLHRFPFGHDAIAYAIIPGSSVNPSAIAAVSSLSKAQLTALYTTAPDSGDSEFGVDASFAYGDNDVVTVVNPVVPRLPQAGSGTRSDFQSFIAAGTPSGVTNAATTVIQENNGLDAEITAYLAANTTAIVIVPFSASSYIAQENSVAKLQTTAGITLGSPDGRPAFTDVSGTLVPDATTTGLYNTASDFDRDTFIVVAESALATDPGVASMVDATYIKSLTYWGASTANNTSKAVKLLFGFSAPLEASTGTRINAEG